MSEQLVQLAPDELELQIASCRGVTRPCPFCDRSPLMFSSFREDTGIYQSRLVCNYRCLAEMSFNARSRHDAQQGVMRNWDIRKGDTK